MRVSGDTAGSQSSRDDVDRLAAGLAGVGELVQEPTTMPGGNRSLLVRDPDGNLVNFFTPVSPEAQATFIRTLPGT